MLFIYSVKLAMTSQNETVLGLLRRLQWQNSANGGLQKKCGRLQYEVTKTEEHVSPNVVLLQWHFESVERVTVQLSNEISKLEAKE